jgi:hypothetical protein
MCSVSWRQTGDRLRLTFNRDERRSRATGLPPRIFDMPYGRAVYPTDAEAGGTWLAANDHGVIACVLNFYGAPSRDPLSSRADRVSRGQLPLRVVRGTDPSEAREDISLSDLSAFDPFILLVLKPSTEGWRMEWDGGSARVTPLDPQAGMETTSSYHTHEVQAFRREMWAEASRKSDAPDALFDLHTRFLPDRPAWGCCMSRADASTVSITCVRLSPQEIAMDYHAVHDGQVEPPLRQRMATR